MTFTITGTVPQHKYDPTKPVFQYLPDEAAISKSILLGSTGRTISVGTDSEAVAKQLVSVFKGVFEDVHLTSNGKASKK